MVEPRAELRFLQTPSGSNLRCAVPRGEIIYLLLSGGRVDAPLRDRVHLSAELSTHGVLSVDFLGERPGRLDGEHRVSALVLREAGTELLPPHEQRGIRLGRWRPTREGDFRVDAHQRAACLTPVAATDTFTTAALTRPATIMRRALASATGG